MRLTRLALSFAVLSATGAAYAQTAVQPPPWGMSGGVPYQPIAPIEVGPGPSDDEPYEDPMVPGPGRVPVEFRSDGDPQTVAFYLGRHTERRGRGTTTVIDYRDICTTPCTAYLHQGRVQLYTHGPWLQSGLHSYDIPQDGMRYVLRTRSVLITLGGYTLIVGTAAMELFGLICLAVGSGIGTSPLHCTTTTGWALLGSSLATGGLATGVMYYALSTGPGSQTPLGAQPEPLSLDSRGASDLARATSIGWTFTF